MEIKITINQHILNWLTSMGYSVSGMPREAIEGMFLREARQWDVSPEQLEALVMTHMTAGRRTPPSFFGSEA